MHFALTEEQTAFTGMVSELLDRECAPDAVRAGWPGGDRDVVGRLWRLLGGTGLFGMCVDGAAGGLELDDGFVVPALEAVGGAGVPGPVADTVAIVTPALAAAGHPSAGAVMAGEAVVACGVGRTGPVPYAAVADLLMLDDGDRVRVHPVDECRVVPVDGVDGARHLGTVTHRGEGMVVPVDRERHLARATLATAAELLGLGQRLLDMSVAYVCDRHQFGRPVGSYQAVKHPLADLQLALSFARPLALRAGWALATGHPDAARAVSSAKAAANDAAERAARTSLQVHGAIAYTVEYDYHLYAKRIWALLPDRGDATSHRLTVADAIGLPVAFRARNTRVD